MSDDDNEVGEQAELDIETTLTKDGRMECRQIVDAIRNYKVGQRQVLYLIQLLALELEARPAMLAILKAVKDSRQDVEPKSILELPEN